MLRRGTVVGWCCAGLLVSAAAGQQSGDAIRTATDLVRAGQYNQAIAAVERSLRTHPKDARLLTIEGIAYSMQGDDVEALRVLNSALRVDPRLMSALRAKAQIMVRQHASAAGGALEAILREDPNDGTAREMLADEQARGGLCKKAIANFVQIGTMLDGHRASLLRYGACLFTEGQYEAAAVQFTKLVAADVGSDEARYDLALAQVRAGETKEARVTLAPLTAKGGDVDTLSLAAEAAEATGDTPQAVALLRRAIVLDPMVADSYVRFGEICLQHESYRAGIEMVSAGLARLPRDVGLYLTRGMLYGGAAEYAKAEIDFRAAESFDPKHGTGAYGVGLVQAQGNHPEAAIQTAREGLKAHPEDGQLNLLLARLEISAGELPGSAGFEDARRAAETSVRVRPDLTAAHDILSNIYMMQGEMAKTTAECQEALRLDPDDMIAMYRLLIASRKMGDTAAVQELTMRVAEGHKKTRETESGRLRYRIEGVPAASEGAPAQP